MSAEGGIELVPLDGGLENGADGYLAAGTYKEQLDQVGWSSLMMRTSKSSKCFVRLHHES